MTPNQLRWEIENGPLATELAGFWSIRNWPACANVLNLPRYSMSGGTRFVPIGEFSQWLTTSGIRFKFRAAERNEGTPPEARDLIDVVFGLERNPHISVVDSTAASTIVAGLKQYGIVNQADEAAFTQLISAPPRYISRSEQIEGRAISSDEIRAASTVEAEE